ncbi:MAG: hypothetical protein U0S36_07060 [Candidatus Nanopelagicales bacterium]
MGITSASMMGASAAPYEDRLLTGVVTKDGMPVAGATVVAVAWPNAATLSRLKEGQRVDTAVVARGTTDASGSFSIRVKPGLLRKYQDSAGAADLQFVVADSTRELTLAFTRRNGENRAVALDLGVTRPSVKYADTPLSLYLDSTGRAPVASSALRTSTKRSAATDALMAQPTLADGLSAVSPAPPTVAGPSCGAYVAGTWRYNLPETFMRVYGWSGAKGTVTQTISSDHTLGIGIKANSADGGLWSANVGTTSTISSGDVRVTTNAVDVVMKNRVNYRDFKNPCGGVLSKPQSIAALAPTADLTYAGHTNFTAYCTTYTGGSYEKSTGSNVTYTAGIDIGPVSVSAKAGYDTDTKLMFTFTAKTKFCGNSSTGIVNSSQVDARAG